MTVPNAEPKNQIKEEHVAKAKDGVALVGKKDWIKKRHHYNNNKYITARMRTQYYAKPDYPLPYVYYYPPSAMYYPPIDNHTNSASIPTTRDEEDLEIIVHDESSVDTRRSSSSDQNKPIDLKKQLEFYFSRQNLVNDTFLVSQMDSELYVPITLVANFKRVREWTADLSLIVQTLQNSSAVTVDESGTKVKPNISVQRNTVILRDVPECTHDEIVELLKELNSPPVQSIKQDIGNMWYFTFQSEDDALKLLLGVRGKSFKDQAIAARMKSEPMLPVQGRNSAAAAASNQNFSAKAIYAYPGNGVNGANSFYPAYNTQTNYGYQSSRYSNTNQQKFNHYQQPSRFSFENHKTFRPPHAAHNKPRYNRNGSPAATTDTIESALNNLTLNDTVQRQQQPTHQNNHTKDNNRFINIKQYPHQANVIYANKTPTNVISDKPCSHEQPTLPRKQQQQQQRTNAKKGRYSNNQQQHDTHHTGGGKLDYKKKRGNKSAHEPKEIKQVEFKPMYFPPLPNQQPSAADELSPAAPPTRSAADIVKSTVVDKPKKSASLVAKKEPPTTTTTFSYADVLKKDS